MVVRAGTLLVVIWRATSLLQCRQQLVRGREALAWRIMVYNIELGVDSSTYKQDTQVPGGCTHSVSAVRTFMNAARCLLDSSEVYERVIPWAEARAAETSTDCAQSMLLSYCSSLVLFLNAYSCSLVLYLPPQDNSHQLEIARDLSEYMRVTASLCRPCESGGKEADRDDNTTTQMSLHRLELDI